VLPPSHGATRHVLLGLAADLCLAFTVADAHTLHKDFWTPRDSLIPSRPGAVGPGAGASLRRAGRDARPAPVLTASSGTAALRRRLILTFRLRETREKPTYVKN